MNFQSSSQQQRIQFFSEKPGTHLLVTAAIHGNEKCGTQAIQRLVESLQTGDLQLERGVLSLVPICNPKAYELHQRFYECNLNRQIHRESVPESYESRLAQNICQWIEDCDVLLDLHSFHSPGDPFFVWNETHSRNIPFTLALGDYPIITDFRSAYEPIAQIQAHTTVGYADRFGKISCTLECGQHDEPEAVDRAAKALRQALIFCKLIDETPQTFSKERDLWRMRHLQMKEKEGRFLRSLREFSPVNKGDEIAEYADGTKVLASQDGQIIFPAENAPVGQEWFFIARREKLELGLKAHS